MAQNLDFKKLAREFDFDKQLRTAGIDSQMQALLEKIRTSEECADLKKQVLTEFFLSVAQSEREFLAEEKDFLFSYLREFLEDAGQGFLFSDRVLARLFKENDAQRTAEIIALMEKREKIEGFFEETAAKLMSEKPDLSEALAKRAMRLCQENEKPRGVVFALALFEQNQLKLAVALLIELAKKGAATGALMYFFRILAKAKGAEKLLADMLLVNLNRLNRLEQTVLRAYTATLYLLGAEAFYENGAYLETVRLLRAERMGGLINDDNELKRKYLELVNRLRSKDKRFQDVFSKVNLTVLAKSSSAQEEVTTAVQKTQLKEVKKEEVISRTPDMAPQEVDVVADVLKITPEEVEQHFEKIKRLSSDAVAQAKGYMKNTGEGALKFKMLAKKIKFFKKNASES